MTRLITTHALRRTTSPSPLWTVLVPGCEPVSAYVPGDIHMIPGLEAYDGSFAYEKKITCAGTLRILFHGVDGHARVLLDGKEIADGCGSITTLVEDIAYEQHLLRVEMEGGAGLIRPVTIEQMGGAYIEEMRIETHRQGRMWLCEATVTIRSLRDEAQLIDLDVTAGPARTHWEEQALPARGTVTLRRTLPAPGAKRWSPDKPQLYTASCVLWLDGEPADDLRDRFGFRSAAYDGGKVLINGHPVEGPLLEREDSADLFGRAVPVEIVVRDVQLLRRMGCAAVRTGADERFLDACDEMGLVVLTDKPCGNHPCVAAGAAACAVETEKFRR